MTAFEKPPKLDVRVGGYLWHFDSNRRVYRPTRAPLSWGGPIYREHWRLVEITGETSRSWITPYGKCPKNAASVPGSVFALTDGQVDDDVFAHTHRHRIASRINHGLHGSGRVSASMLRQVAAIIGYDTDETS